jgi:hypothetical protein
MCGMRGGGSSRGDVFVMGGNWVKSFGAKCLQAVPSRPTSRSRVGRREVDG